METAAAAAKVPKQAGKAENFLFLFCFSNFLNYIVTFVSKRNKIFGNKEFYTIFFVYRYTTTFLG